MKKKSNLEQALFVQKCVKTLKAISYNMGNVQAYYTCSLIYKKYHSNNTALKT